MPISGLLAASDWSRSCRCNKQFNPFTVKGNIEQNSRAITNVIIENTDKQKTPRSIKMEHHT